MPRIPPGEGLTTEAALRCLDAWRDWAIEQENWVSLAEHVLLPAVGYEYFGLDSVVVGA